MVFTSPGMLAAIHSYSTFRMCVVVICLFKASSHILFAPVVTNPLPLVRDDIVDCPDAQLYM